MRHRLIGIGLCLFVGLGLTSCHHGPVSPKKLVAEAEAGDMRAQEKLGSMYFICDGVSADKKKAFFWYEQAAAQGSHFGYSEMGFLYEFGHGVEPDIFKAVMNYEIAARLNNASAQSAMARLHASGALGARNYLESHMWQILSGRHSPLFGYVDYQAANHLSVSEIKQAEVEARRIIRAFPK